MDDTKKSKKKITKQDKEEEKKKEPDYIGHRQRLKARFLADLGRSMPDYELLELILTYSIPRRDVKPMAKELIRKYTNLVNVLVAPASDVIEDGGVSNNTAVLLSLIHACCNKICWENLESRDAPMLTNKEAIVEYCRSCIGYSNQENLLIIYLNKVGRFITKNIEQVGTIDAVMISPRDIVAKSLKNNAVSIIIAHNHPSGNNTPSNADVDMTKQLAQALEVVGIKLEDHLIITTNGYFSMREKAPYVLHPRRE